jgi:putative hydrolase of the HAD superfamily
MKEVRPAVVAFDLGDTLLEYEGIPFSWEAHYSEALQALAASLLRRELTAAETAGGSAVLRRYNTRLNPRTEEVPFAAILATLWEEWQLAGQPDAMVGARAFFGIFRQRTRPFPDALPCLRRIRERGGRIGIFTDVPYGMQRELVEEDVVTAGLGASYDILLTSIDVGWRKPAAQTMTVLAERLGCDCADFAYIGNERKDIEAARAAGCRAVLLDRKGARPDWGQSTTLRTLDEWIF